MENRLSTEKKEASKECKEEPLPLPEKSKMIKLNSDMDKDQGSNTYDPSMESYHPLEDAFWKTEKMYV